MAKEIKARYSDEELENFRNLIEEKINKAQTDLELLKSAYTVSYTHLTLPTILLV